MSTVLNRSSVKRYALAVSAARRADKFSRVSEEFLLRCESKLESEIRAIAGDYSDTLPLDNLSFITKVARVKAEEKLESLARRIIYMEVLKHPSLGCTLK